MAQRPTHFCGPTRSAYKSPPVSRMPARSAMVPIGAMLLAGSLNSMAQQATAGNTKTLQTVTVTDTAEAPEGKDAVRATSTSIGKGNQQLRDIPQSITVVTEKLVDDRNLDTLKEALHNTAGISFMAAEGGEEDIRLRGFSLAGTGDIFADGMRDPAFYDRDTFNLDRIEVLRGSASMLFGRGSTGGAVNQVNKLPRAIDQHEITTTLGSYKYARVLGDFNLHTGENAGLRINTMVCDLIDYNWWASGTGAPPDPPLLAMSPHTLAATNALREFMYQNVYLDSRAKADDQKVRQMIDLLYRHFVAHPEQLPADLLRINAERSEPIERAVVDYIAGMTDRYAIKIFNDLYVPRTWGA